MILAHVATSFPIRPSVSPISFLLKCNTVYHWTFTSHPYLDAMASSAFCRPRIHDLSQLGWKEKRHMYGNLFLEPETTRHQQLDDTVVLSPYTNDIEGVDGGVRYGIFGEYKAQGIEASDNIIKVEFHRRMHLPNEDAQDIEPTGCSFCDILTHVLVDARYGANKPWNYTIPIYALKFHFEFELMFLKEDAYRTVLSDRVMLLKHIMVEYQPRISLAELIFPVGVLPGL